MNEIEVKYQLVFLPKIKKLMDANDFVFSSKYFERNIVFDTRDEELKKAGKLFRLRLTTKDLINITGVLTSKTKVPSNEFKYMDEVETFITNPAAVLQVLKSTFEKRFEYQKFRSEYRSEKLKVVACVDELPIGTFLELESRVEDNLRNAIKVLKLDKLSPVIKSYPDLCGGKNQTYEFAYVKRAFGKKKINDEFIWD